MDTRDKIFDMSENLPLFHGSSRVSASCAQLFTNTSELITGACE